MIIPCYVPAPYPCTSSPCCSPPLSHSQLFLPKARRPSSFPRNWWAHDPPILRLTPLFFPSCAWKEGDAKRMRFVSETPIFMGPLLGFARKLAGWFPSLFSAFVTVIHNSLLPFGFGFPVLVFSVLSQTVATITLPSFVRDPKPFPCAYLWKLIHSPPNTANVCPRLCSRDG